MLRSCNQNILETCGLIKMLCFFHYLRLYCREKTKNRLNFNLLNELCNALAMRKSLTGDTPDTVPIRLAR